MIDATAIDAIAVLAKRGQEPAISQFDQRGNQYVTGADGTVRVIPPVDPILPMAIQENPVFAELASFVEYCKLYGSAATPIMCGLQQKRMDAVLNYHYPRDGTTMPKVEHGTHIATFVAEVSYTLKPWLGINRRWMSQVEFAYFIEENMETIGSPAGADLLTMAETLKVHRDMVFKSNKRLKDGTVDFELVEKDNVTSGAQHVGVPDNILIVSPVFLLRPAQEITAKLRYKVEKGAPLMLRVDLISIETVMIEAFLEMVLAAEENTKFQHFIVP